MAGGAFVATLGDEGMLARPSRRGRPPRGMARHTRPIVFGDELAVCFAWLEHDRRELPRRIELGRGGFGNGDHPTTGLLVDALAVRIEGGERVLDVDRHHVRRPEAECTQPEHAAAAAGIEDPLPTLDPKGQRIDEQSRRRMVSVAESPPAELDQPRQLAAIVLGPREAHGELVAEDDRAGVPPPCLEAGALVGTRHGQHALVAQRRDETLLLPLVAHRGQHQPPVVARCHHAQAAPAEVAEAVLHRRHLVLGGGDDDHPARLPEPVVLSPQRRRPA